MIDARLSGRLLTDARFWRISADAWRLYCAALVWSVNERTDGRLIANDLPYVLPLADLDRAPELVEVGYWLPRPGGWDIADFATTQTRAAVLDAADYARTYERNKKARQRSHKRGDHRLCEPNNCTETVPDTSRDIPGHVPGTTQERTGQDRTGAYKEDKHSPNTEPTTRQTGKTETHPDGPTEVRADPEPAEMDSTTVDGFVDADWLNYGTGNLADVQARALRDCRAQFGGDCYSDPERFFVYSPDGETWWCGVEEPIVSSSASVNGEAARSERPW